VASPRVVVLVTGSELVRGDRRDANGPFLAAELSRLGLEPARVTIVGDRAEDLSSAFRESLEADLCVVSGGLGPTHDDRTVEVLAAATERPLIVDAALEREIEAFSRAIAERMKRPYADFAAGVRKQASLPQGAVSLGLAGSAPALLLEHDGRVVVVLPGPPAELQRLWPAALEHAAVKAIVGRVRPPQRRVLRFFGPSESAVALALAETGGEEGGLEVTVCARDLEIHVDVFNAEGEERRASAIVEGLRSAFPEDLFALDDERPVEELVLDACRTQHLRLATAESCTGGMVGMRLTDVPGSSDVYLGGVIAYSDDVKRRELDVPDAVLREHGAVSAETAAAMAEGARARLDADVAVSVTGIAGPGGGSPDKPVGLVHIAVDSVHGQAARSAVLPGDREAIRTRATALALHLLRTVVTRSATHARDSAV